MQFFTLEIFGENHLLSEYEIVPIDILLGRKSEGDGIAVLRMRFKEWCTFWTSMRKTFEILNNSSVPIASSHLNVREMYLDSDVHFCAD